MDMINVISLNCHGFNISTSSYLQNVAHNADVILLVATGIGNLAL